MRSGKKILAFALATATVVPMMFSGCQGNTSSTAPTSSTKPKETVTLKVFTGDKAIQGIDRVTKAVNDYLAKKDTGLAISWETMTWDDLGKKGQTMLQTGQDADVMFVSGWNGGGIVGYATSGYLTDLTKYVNDAANKDVVDTILGKSFLTKVNGKYYAMPTNKEKAHNFGYLALTDEVKKLNIDPASIKTMDDMAKYFDAAKKDKLTPVCSAQMDNPFKFLDWDVADSDGTPGAFDPTDEKKIVDQFTADKTVSFYKEMKTWHDKGYFAVNASTASSQETEMKSGKYFCGSWSLMPGKAISESTSLGLKLTQFDITPVEESNRETTGAMLAIPAASKHKDEAFKLIKLLYTDKELINLMTYGVKDTDYTLKSDNIIEVNAKSDFQSAGGWIMGNQFNNYLTSTQDPNLFKSIETYNKSAKVLDSCGFTFDKSKVATQYASCQEVVKKYTPQLFFGTCKDVDATVKEFKAKLASVGEDKLLAEMQTQYDAFLASKK